jgi:hypothetical protein
VSRRAILVTGGLLTGLVAAAAVAGVALLRSPAERPPTLIGGAAMGTFLEPVAHRFADRVAANVEIVLDPRVVREDSVTVATQFSPYTVVATQRDRSSARGVTSLRWTYRLMCLETRCRPPTGRARDFQFPPARVSFRRVNGSPSTLRQEWHALRAVSRLDAEEASREQFTARQHPLPPVTYRVSPAPLVAGLVAAAAMLALLGGGLLWWAFGPAVLGHIDRVRFSRLNALQRQLVVLRDAVRRSDSATERKALDALARELRRNGNGTEELARGARRLAWSAGDLRADEVLEFADHLETSTRGSQR